MHSNTAQHNKVNNKLLIGAAALFVVMSLPSIFILAKVAIGLAMLSVGIIAFKVTLKVLLNTLEQSETNKNHSIRDKIINIAIGLTSVFIGALSLLIMAKTGLIAVCAAFTALVLHEYTKSEEKEAAKKDQPLKSSEKDGFIYLEQGSAPIHNEEKSKSINEIFDETAVRIVECATKLCITGVEKFSPAQNLQAESRQV
ncbi:hypothetical protein [Wolbachia endosymbiont of Folsomia candida]|uniref:hypothetical protein n=1 Tax=Wolbachia endosymbiont of Folsomia candida TaxID=169402 RepID=UPI000AFA492E|nr:hypothetical protein [Wolbachia endosymbiont of Folsomia candida]APR98013.1 hypothetical protein ASM33_01675 [Wolbachia endosymbiont of Folsomia candida]